MSDNGAGAGWCWIGKNYPYERIFFHYRTCLYIPYSPKSSSSSTCLHLSFFTSSSSTTSASNSENSQPPCPPPEWTPPTTSISTDGKSILRSTGRIALQRHTAMIQS